MTFTPDETRQQKSEFMKYFQNDPVLAERDDVIYCMEYLRMTQLPQTDRAGSRIASRPTDAQLCTALGLTRKEFNRMISEWMRKDEDGVSIFDRMRYILYGRIAEEIYNSQLRVMAAMPAILDNIIDIAQSSRSPTSALEAARWLMTEFVMPAKSKYEPSDDERPSKKASSLAVIEDMASGEVGSHPLSIGDSPLLDDSYDLG